MAKAIDHTARRQAIVAQSLKLFATRGYAKVNFGMIANSCGLARTILYTYFKDKRSIFNESIEEVTRQIRATYDVVNAKNASAKEKIRDICTTVFSVMFINRDFVCVIADVLANYRRKGALPLERIRAHTEGLFRALMRLLSEGVTRGEFRETLDVASFARALYAQFEALALRLAITGTANRDDCSANVNALLQTI